MSYKGFFTCITMEKYHGTQLHRIFILPMITNLGYMFSLSWSLKCLAKTLWNMSSKVFPFEKTLFCEGKAIFSLTRCVTPYWRTLHHRHTLLVNRVRRYLYEVEKNFKKSLRGDPCGGLSLHLGWISLTSQISVIPPHPSPLIFSSLPHLFWPINASFPSWDRGLEWEKANTGGIRTNMISHL